MPLIESILTILIGWWLLSLLFHRITSPLWPVVRWGKKWSSRGWHRFWKNTWDVLYRKPAQQRGAGFGVFWLACIIYGFYALSVMSKGEGYDTLFYAGLALAFFKFMLGRYKRAVSAKRTLPNRKKWRR
jgi:hypothetical protein